MLVTVFDYIVVIDAFVIHIQMTAVGLLDFGKFGANGAA